MLLSRNQLGLCLAPHVASHKQATYLYPRVCNTSTTIQNYRGGLRSRADGGIPLLEVRGHLGRAFCL